MFKTFLRCPFFLDFACLTFPFMQPLWEVELDAYLTSTFGTADPSIAPTESNTLSKLQETLSISALQAL